MGVSYTMPPLLWWSDHSSTRTCASVRSAECRLQYLGRLGSQDEGVKLQGGAAPRAGSCSLGPWDFWIARLSPSWRFVIDGRLVFWGAEGGRGGQLGQSGLDSRGGEGVPSPSSTQISECRALGRQAEAEAVAVGGMDGQKASDALGIQTSPHSRLTHHTHLPPSRFTPQPGLKHARN